MEEKPSVLPKVVVFCWNLDIIRKTRLGRKEGFNTNIKNQEGERVLAQFRRETKSPLQIKTPHVNKYGLLNLCIWRRHWQPTPVFLPRESQGHGSLVAAIYGVAQSQT